MTSAQLHRAVAVATGETCHTIRARGFSLVEPFSTEPPAETGGLFLDCPGCGQEVLLTRGPFDQLPELAECPTCDSAYPYALEEVYDRGLTEAAAIG